MNTKSTNTKLLAVLIDADNIPAKHADLILKEITALGEPALRRVYGDWSSDQLAPWKAEVRKLGLVAMQESANTKGKNASDIGLVIDAMDILHTGRFDGFVLVSSDSDFTALANRIREEGKDVFGIGEAKTPESLRNVCNRFIFIENIVEETPSEPVSEHSAKDIQGPQPTGKKSPVGAVKIIRSAMTRIDPDGEWYHLGKLGQFILAEHPDFDSRTYGFGKLSSLLDWLDHFETKRRSDNSVYVRKTG